MFYFGRKIDIFHLSTPSWGSKIGKFKMHFFSLENSLLVFKMKLYRRIIEQLIHFDELREKLLGTFEYGTPFAGARYQKNRIPML